MSLLFCSLHTFIFQVWSHVHFAFDQDDNVTIADCSEDDPMGEEVPTRVEPTIMPEEPWLILELIS